MASVRLNHALPAADLADCFSMFYDFATDAAQFDEVERIELPQIRFRLTPGRSEYRFADGKVQLASAIHIIGPTTGAVRVRAEGQVDAFGAGITATGWAVLIGVPADAMLDRVVDAADLLQVDANQLGEAAAALAQAPSIEARIAVAERLLRGLVREANRATIAFIRTVDAWLAGSPSPVVIDLVDATDLSRRQVERRCSALYGVPPKLLARKYRALRAVTALVRGDEALDDLLARGFYDQSHLIREVKRFTGLTPGQMQADPATLGPLTILRGPMPAAAVRATQPIAPSRFAVDPTLANTHMQSD